MPFVKCRKNFMPVTRLNVYFNRLSVTNIIFYLLKTISKNCEISILDKTLFKIYVYIYIRSIECFRNIYLLILFLFLFFKSIFAISRYSRVAFLMNVFWSLICSKPQFMSSAPRSGLWQFMILLRSGPGIKS